MFSKVINQREIKKRENQHFNTLRRSCSSEAR